MVKNLVKQPCITKITNFSSKNKNKPNKIYQLSPMQQTGCPKKDIIW